MVKNYSKFYNPERKVRFLEEEYPNDSTRETYASILRNSAKFEKDKSKDVCDFSYSEIVDLMIGLGKKTSKSLNVTKTILIKYVDWCYDQKYTSTPNQIKLLTKENLLKQTNQIAQKNSIITRDEMYDICNNLYNPIDRAVIALPFEGVRGRTEIDNTFEELRNLNTADVLVNENTVIATRNNGERRYVQVDKRTTDILVAAINQKDYYKGNGDAKGRFAIMPLKDTGYVLRTIAGRENANLDDKIIATSINNKFKNIRTYTGISFLTPTTLFQSGLIERCEILEKEIGELYPENFRQIYRDLKLDDRSWHDLKEKYKMYKRNIVPE